MLEETFDPAKREVDLIVLTAQVFGPMVAAAVVACLPRRMPELTRWVAVSLAAGLLTLGLCRFIDYYTILDSYSDRTVATLYHPATTLTGRSDQQAFDATQPVPRPYRSDDLFVRRPWVGRLGIDYALGIDGLGLAVTLLAALATLTAAVASFRTPDNQAATLAGVFVLQSAATGAALAVDLALMSAFLALVMLVIALFLASARALGPAAVVAGLVGAGGVVTAVFLLASTDVRDVAEPGVARADAAIARQLDPRLTEAEARASTAVRTHDPVTLSRAVRAASLIYAGHAERVTPRTSPVPPPGAGREAVPLYAPGTDVASAEGRLRSQWPLSPAGQRVIFLGLTLFAAAGLGLVPLHRWLAESLTRLPTIPAVALAGAALPLFGLLTIRLLLMLGAGTPGLWPALTSLGCLTLFVALLQGIGTTGLRQVVAAQTLAAGGWLMVGLGSWGDDLLSWEPGVASATLVVIATAFSNLTLLWVSHLWQGRFHHDDVSLSAPGPTRLGWLTGTALVLGTALPGTAVLIAVAGILRASFACCPSTAIVVTILTLLLVAQRLTVVARLFQKSDDTRELADLTGGEFAPATALIALQLAAGLAPSLIYLWLDPSVQGLASAAHGVR